MADEKKIVLIENIKDGDSSFTKERNGINPFLGLFDSLIEDSWCRETSARPDLWNSEGNSRAVGQCAVTALLVQDLIGGDILRAEILGFGSHYWNQFAHNGGGYVTQIDLTRRQFPKGLVLEISDYTQRSNMLLSSRAKQYETPRRYRLLRDRFLKRLNDGVRARLSGSWFEDAFRK